MTILAGLILILVGGFCLYIYVKPYHEQTTLQESCKYVSLLLIVIGLLIITFHLFRNKKNPQKSQPKENIVFIETFKNLRISKNILDQQVLLVLANDTYQDIDNIKVKTDLFTFNLPKLPSKKFITIKEWNNSHYSKKYYRKIKKIKLTIDGEYKVFNLDKPITNKGG